MSIAFKIFSVYDKKAAEIFSDKKLVLSENCLGEKIRITGKINNIELDENENCEITVEGGWIIRGCSAELLIQLKKGDIIELYGSFCNICVGNIRVLIIDGDIKVLNRDYNLKKHEFY